MSITNIFRLAVVAVLWIVMAGYVITHAVINFFTIFALIASAVIVFVPMWRKYGTKAKNT